MHQAVEQKPCAGQAPERTNASADDNAACKGVGIVTSSGEGEIVNEKQGALLSEKHRKSECVHTGVETEAVGKKTRD
jgi:hypothetical protein